MTCVDRETVLARLTRPPFTAALGNRKRGAHQLGIGLLLDWLEKQPGETWQDRWLSSGVERAGRARREIPLDWLGERGSTAGWQHDAFFRALYLVIAADVIRPSVSLLIAAVFRRGVLPRVLGQCRDATAGTELSEKILESTHKALTAPHGPRPGLLGAGTVRVGPDAT